MTDNGPQTADGGRETNVVQVAGCKLQVTSDNRPRNSQLATRITNPASSCHLPPHSG
jgi:hypothetical protein